MAESTPTPRRSHLRRFLYVLPILLLTVGFFAYPAIRYRLTHVVTEDAFVDAPLVAVSASVSGRIARIAISEGDTALAGQALFYLQDGIYRAESNAAQARVDHARSMLLETGLTLEIERRKAGPTAQREHAEWIAAQARLAGAQIALEDAARQLQRIEKLSASALISESELETTRIRRDQRQSELDAVREEVHKAAATRALAHIEGIALHQQREETARAELRRAQAECEAAELRLSNTIVHSPVRGVVAHMMIRTGERIEENQTLCLIRNLDAMWITANIEETQIRHIQPGQIARIAIDAFPGRTFSGHVLHIGSVTKSQLALIPRQSRAGTFVKVIQRIPVRIAIIDADSLLKPGMSATVGIGLPP